MKTYLKHLQKVNRKKRINDSFFGKSANEIASSIILKNNGFLQSPEWKFLRLNVIDYYGGKCMCCGKTPTRGVNVDHIHPRKTHPELALSFENLQILCGTCNKRKGNKHATDYRKPLSERK